MERVYKKLTRSSKLSKVMYILQQSVKLATKVRFFPRSTMDSTMGSQQMSFMYLQGKSLKMDKEEVAL